MKKFKKAISILMLVSFFSSLIVAPAGAQVLPLAGTSIGLTAGFQPPVLLGLKIHPENPLLFDFIVDQGQAQLSQDELKNETEKLVKYFLAALTIPDKEVWVNLSPSEKDRIIPDVLGQTIMGKTMLEQDYLLKQLASSLTNPETDLGQQYWQKAGTAPTLSKVWIVPEKAEVLESNGIVLVGEKRLKVKMEEGTQGAAVFQNMILPAINKTVNESKDFSDVRQIYNSVILATWYKQALKESLLGKVYADKSKVAGVETDDKEMKQRIYEQYLVAFKKGAYNLIKEEADFSTGETIPRKYFSGGISSLAPDNLTVKQVSSSVVQNGISKASSALIVTVVGEEPEPAKLASSRAASPVNGVGQSKVQSGFLNEAFNARTDEELAARMQEIPFATNVERLTRYLLKERSLDRGMEAYRFVEINFAGNKNELVVVRSIEDISRDSSPQAYLAQVTLAALQDPRVASMLTRRQFFAEALKRIVVAQLRVQAFNTALAKVVFYDPLLQITTAQGKEQLAYAMDRLTARIENDKRGELARLAIPEGYTRLGVHGLIVPIDDARNGFLLPPLSRVDLGYEGPPRWQIFATELMSRAGLDKGKIIQQNLRDRMLALIPWDLNGRFETFEMRIETYAEKAFEEEALVVDLIREKAAALTGVKDEGSMVVTESLSRQIVEWLAEMGEDGFTRLLEAEFYRKHLADNHVLTSDEDLKGMLERMPDPRPFMESLPKLNELKQRVGAMTDSSQIRLEILRSMPAVMAEMKTMASAKIEAQEEARIFVAESMIKIEKKYGPAMRQVIDYMLVPPEGRKLLVQILLGQITYFGKLNAQLESLQKYLQDDNTFEAFIYGEIEDGILMEEAEPIIEQLKQAVTDALGTTNIVIEWGLSAVPRFTALTQGQISTLVNYLLTSEPAISSEAAQVKVGQLLLEHQNDMDTFLQGLTSPYSGLVPRAEEDPDAVGSASSGVVTLPEGAARELAAIAAKVEDKEAAALINVRAVEFILQGVVAHYGPGSTREGRAFPVFLDPKSRSIFSAPTSVDLDYSRLGPQLQATSRILLDYLKLKPNTTIMELGTLPMGLVLEDGNFATYPEFVIELEKRGIILPLSDEDRASVAEIIPENSSAVLAQLPILRFNIIDASTNRKPRMRNSLLGMGWPIVNRNLKFALLDEIGNAVKLSAAGKPEAIDIDYLAETLKDDPLLKNLERYDQDYSPFSVVSRVIESTGLRIITAREWDLEYFQRSANKEPSAAALTFLAKQQGTASSGVAESKTAPATTVASTPVGGIDFDPTNMNLQIKRDGKGVPLPLPQQNLEQINIQGLFPVIINIVPVNPQTLPIFLGQAPQEPAKEPPGEGRPELAASTAS